ncbi:hypothetical protein JKP88DRAFT_326022 [Tribonema minus]|uniref:Uncharacterized protein n=1 Tax=Tribonema minus TaxID=303371 RepID=A0A836CBX0_9STRA|nr:hypothetical protein JKP88DRAFT_326022 [Tribonema minus]
MAADGEGNPQDTLMDTMTVLLQQQCLPFGVVHTSKAFCEGIAASTGVRLDAACQSDVMAALASTFVRRCIVKLHLSGHFPASLQQAQPLGWSSITSLTLHKFKGGISSLPPNLEQLCLNRTVLDAEMMHVMTTTAPASLHTLKLLRCPIACAVEELKLPTTLRTFACAQDTRGASELPCCTRAFRIRLPDGLQHLHLMLWGVLEGTPFPTSLESLHLQCCAIGNEQGNNHSQQQRDRHDGVRVPAGLRKLAVADCEFNSGFGDLPPSLITFDASRDNGANLANADHDECDEMCDGYLFNPYTWSLAPLPPGLVHLDLRDLDVYDAPLGPLPCTLQFLHMGWQFGKELGPLPPGLTHLQLGRSYNRALGPLPHTLQQLETASDGVPVNTASETAPQNRDGVKV